MIREISIKNFKSIQNETIRLKGINILIGANNAGKSNLLEALEFYQRMLVMELQEVFGPGPYSFRSVFYRGGDFRSDSIDITIVHQNNQAIIHTFNLENYRNKGPGLKFPLRIKHETLKIDNLEEINTNSPYLLLRKKYVNHELEAESDMLNFVRSCRSIRKFQFVPKEIKREQIIDSLEQVIPFLQSNGFNLVNVLYGIRDSEPKIFNDIIKDFKEIFPDVAGLSFKHLGESRYALEFTRKVGGWRFLGPEISDGFVITLAIITLINMPNSPKIILIEEIENGLNPSTLRIVLERIMKASEISGIQFLITSHSPILMELLSQNPEYIIICEQDKGKSKYIPLKEILLKFGKDYEPGESIFQLWFDGLIGGL